MNTQSAVIKAVCISEKKGQQKHPVERVRLRPEHGIEGDAHAGTFREERGGAFGEAAVAWLDWNLKGRKDAAAKFLGKDNMFDSGPLWIEYKYKNVD